MSIAELLDYIDWNPFFAVWQLRGKYPNRGYPKIFNDADVGPVAKKTFDDAQKMLQDWMKSGQIKSKGVVGFYPASGNDEDIDVKKKKNKQKKREIEKHLSDRFDLRQIYDPENPQKKIATLYCLRQQMDDPSANAHLSLVDFVAPASSGIQDYVGKS